MAEKLTEKPVHYCFQCGNRLGSNLAFCWYCGAPLEREIRPMRRCPYCAEVVRREAVKCRHCGEFLDGRPREDTGTVRQIVVIDKNLLQAMSDLKLMSGAPVPDYARQVLDERTVRAIENDAPEMIRQPGVRVLPPPEEPPSPAESPEAPERRGPREPPDRPESREGPKQIEARVEDLPRPEPPPKLLPQKHEEVRGKRHPLLRMQEREPQALAKREADALAKPPDDRSRSALAKPPRERYGLAKRTGAERGRDVAAERVDDTIDAQADELFRACIKCNTEIFASDNFCYYCGQQYHQTQVDKRRARRKMNKAVKQAVLFVILLAFVAAIAGVTYLVATGGLDRKKLDKLNQGFDQAKQKLRETKDKLVETKDKVVDQVERKIGTETSKPTPQPIKQPTAPSAQPPTAEKPTGGAPSKPTPQP